MNRRVRNFDIEPGEPYPVGATLDDRGVNFSVFSRHANSVELLLYRRAGSSTPFQVIPLHPEVNRTFYVWHVRVLELPAGTWYCWRMDGPRDIRNGLHFDSQKNLLDPWAKAVSDRLWDRSAACVPGDNGPCSMRCGVIKEHYDWEGDAPLEIRSEDSIIYEMHVGGFTRHASSGVENPGTFSGMIEKIPYLKELGITHVELLPVMAFDEQDVPPETAALGLKNYWGYSTHSFFSPHPGYATNPEQGSHVREFRDLVKALHRAGIGIILDVVFNHTSEAGLDGPIINFRGMGAKVFYHLDPGDKRVYRDYTGCGNTINANHPIVTSFIIRCLEYWVREMHVDGFRFDLASALARGEGGEPLQDPPVLWGIELSEELIRKKLIAEAWDAAGLYQVGSFPGYRWAEWNGRYRDVMRKFLRGDRGMVGEVATRLSGSSDLYEPQARLPINSVNFITCHDGFTLIDLMSYREKHNWANGEQNRDGSNDNLSCNYGVEGETDDPAILAVRRRQAKNAVVLLLLSQGVPMLLAGDEVLKSQGGNNNGYCQDNELTWFDWSLVDENGEMLRFVRQMIALRKRHPSLRRRRFLSGRQDEGEPLPDISWHGSELNRPPWNDDEARILAFTLAAVAEGEAHLHVMLNMSPEDVSMEIPSIAGYSWSRSIDTARPSPADALSPSDWKPLQKSDTYLVKTRSVVVLEGASSIS